MRDVLQPPPERPPAWISLRTLLALLTTGPMVLTVIITAWLSVRAGEALVDDMVLDLQREVASGAAGAVRQTLSPPHLLNGLNQDLLDDGILDSADHEQLQHVFFDQLRRFRSIGYVQLGLESGDFVGVERTDDGFRVERTDEARSGKTVWALDDHGTRVGDAIEVVAGYQPAARPWYQAAVSAGSPTWSSIYQFSSRDTVRLGITAVQPWTHDGSVRGVLGADIVLEQLGRDLGRTRLRPGGRVFLVERSGELVAHNIVRPPFRVDGDRNAHRLQMAEAPDALTAAAASVLGERLRSLNEPVQQEVMFEGDVAYVYATPIRDGRGIDWVAVVALPRSDFTPELRANTRRTILLGFLATLLAIGMGFVSWRWVGGPLLQLGDAAEALARGERLPLPTSRMTELRKLSGAFDEMRNQLDARQDAVARARDEAVLARRTAEEGSRAKSSFLASMSHELRTPLNAILGYAELLVEERSAKGAPSPDLDRILEAGRHLLGIVTDVLDLSRIEAGRVSLSSEDTDLADLVMTVVEQLQGMIAEGGNRLVVQTTADIWVVTDPQKVRQCLVNLVSNAAKYTENGRVTVRVIPGGEFVHIEVRDTGVGIPREHLRDLFDPFYQVGGAHQRAGTGLGLSITREYARALGGDVTVRSKYGKGTVFTLSLPLKKPT